MKSKQPNYMDARICRNCMWHDMKLYGPSRSIGYFCTLYDCRCCKTKVCDSHEYEGKNDCEL